MAQAVYVPIQRKPLSPGSGEAALQSPGDSLLGNHKLEGSTASTTVIREAPESSASPKTILSVHFLRLTIVAFTTSSLGLAAWIMYYTQTRVDSWTRSTAIGGNFTQTQAKIIDFLTSAIGAPLVLALFNYASFQIARACVVDTQTATSIFTLKVLVEVGTTTFGSYNPFKLVTLLATWKVRVVLLAFAAALSAVSFSTLTNVIAYEAFQATANDQQPVRLEYLYSPPGQSALQKEVNNLIITKQLPVIPNAKLLSEFTSQYFEVMTTLSFTTADSRLDNGNYIGLNVTNASLSSVPSNFDILHDVPAYQLSYTCAPTSAENVFFVNSPTVLDLLEIGLNLDVPGYAPNGSFESFTWNGGSAVADGLLTASAFIAFPAQEVVQAPKVFYLGVFSETPLLFGTEIHSPFGVLPYTVFNNTDAGGSAYTNMYGVACEISHHVGTVDLRRQSNSTTWSRSSGTFDKQHSDLPLIMPDLQLFPNFVGPVPNPTSSVMPGIGGALASSTNLTSVLELLKSTYKFADFDTFAKNYVYAEGEARRIAYEVAQSAPGQQGTSYSVQATGTTLRYQIMFVPWILLVGLLTMALAGICVVVLVCLARKSMFSRTGRVVSPTRLVADAVAGLPKEEFEAVSSLTDGELETWSSRFKAQYDISYKNGRIELRPAGSAAWAHNIED